jgi:uncharacterized protein (TIGR02001 family)
MEIRQPMTRARTRSKRIRPLACLLLAAASPAAYCADAGTAADDDATLNAQDAARSPVSGALSANSQYVTRGLRLSDGHPSAQATLDVAIPSGWEAGSSITTISDHVVDNGAIAWDVHAGYRAQAGPVGWSALLATTRYPGAARVDGARYDYTDLVAGASWTAPGATTLHARYRYTVSRDYFGIPDARGTGYLDVGARHPLGRRMTLDLHAGDGRVAGVGNDGWDWRDVKAGLTRRLEDNWVLKLNYTRALGSGAAFDRVTPGVPRAGRGFGGNLSRRAIVLSLSKTF